MITFKKKLRSQAKRLYTSITVHSITKQYTAIITCICRFKQKTVTSMRWLQICIWHSPRDTCILFFSFFSFFPWIIAMHVDQISLQWCRMVKILIILKNNFQNKILKNFNINAWSTEATVFHSFHISIERIHGIKTLLRQDKTHHNKSKKRL